MWHCDLKSGTWIPNVTLRSQIWHLNPKCDTPIPNVTLHYCIRTLRIWHQIWHSTQSDNPIPTLTHTHTYSLFLSLAPSQMGSRWRVRLFIYIYIYIYIYRFETGMQSYLTRKFDQLNMCMYLYIYIYVYIYVCVYICSAISLSTSDLKLFLFPGCFFCRKRSAANCKRLSVKTDDDSSIPTEIWISILPTFATGL